MSHSNADTFSKIAGMNAQIVLSWVNFWTGTLMWKNGFPEYRGLNTYLNEHLIKTHNKIMAKKQVPSTLTILRHHRSLHCRCCWNHLSHRLTGCSKIDRRQNWSWVHQCEPSCKLTTTVMTPAGWRVHLQNSNTTYRIASTSEVTTYGGMTAYHHHQHHHYEKAHAVCQ